MSALVMRDSVTYFASTNVCGTKKPVLCSIISVENALNVTSDDQLYDAPCSGTGEHINVNKVAIHYECWSKHMYFNIPIKY